MALHLKIFKFSLVFFYFKHCH